MVVRGAPAIGISAAYGVALAARHAGTDDWQGEIERAMDELARSRPTAVNLFWALERMGRVFRAAQSLPDAAEQLAAEAILIHKENRPANHARADPPLGVRD